MHDHDHDVHAHAPGLGGVVLDVGGDVGALVVVLGDAPDVDELDIQPVGDPSRRFHTGVHARSVDGAPTRTAVYPEVVAGRYELLDGGGRPFAEVTATGGEVRTIDLR
jgi:hypothetical protein